MANVYPEPQVGMVVNYCFLWPRQARKGQDVGEKNRPCLIMAVDTPKDGSPKKVFVAPITHTPPFHPEDSLQMPQETKRRLGLDSETSWLMLSDVNKFSWPGYDLGRVPRRNQPTIVYGNVSASFMNEAQKQMRDMFHQKRVQIVPRDEPSAPRR